MTFKHINFEDSSTMRSLVKVAKEKGWLPEQQLEKTAENKAVDYFPTENLTVNILKLCSGLRQLGHDESADELEDKFFVYKKAASLYETSKETGEDLVDQAHPEGSHQLKGVLGDGLVETIVDQQLAHIKIVNKTPTGKLSSAQLINKVKVVLAQPAPYIPQASGVIPDLVETAVKPVAVRGATFVASKLIPLFTSVPGISALVGGTILGLMAGNAAYDMVFEKEDFQEAGDAFLDTAKKITNQISVDIDPFDGAFSAAKSVNVKSLKNKLTTQPGAEDIQNFSNYLNNLSIANDQALKIINAAREQNENTNLISHPINSYNERNVEILGSNFITVSNKKLIPGINLLNAALSAATKKGGASPAGQALISSYTALKQKIEQTKQSLVSKNITDPKYLNFINSLQDNLNSLMNKEDPQTFQNTINETDKSLNDFIMGMSKYVNK